MRDFDGFWGGFIEDKIMSVIYEWIGGVSFLSVEKFYLLFMHLVRENFLNESFVLV